jgi:glycosyltransferase involved in cell wall biosynthesis
VLLSDIPENLEVGEDCAMSFRNRDVADLRAKLETLLHDPALVRSYEAKARDYIRQQYSWDRVAQKTEGVYQDLLGGPRPRR